MSKKLREVIDNYLMKTGPSGKATLSVKLNRAPVTIDRWLRQGAPTSHDAYQLALACGCSEEEAAAIGREQPSTAKETA